ncbi:MAG: hypothetical protein IKA79_08155 [Lentisphaeria bacterium]|nr:hypothetical protein [Lentisphaeria bacterium]
MPGKRDWRPDGRFAVGDLVMNRYKVLAVLGQGGMGGYKCFDEGFRNRNCLEDAGA